MGKTLKIILIVGIFLVIGLFIGRIALTYYYPAEMKRVLPNEKLAAAWSARLYGQKALRAEALLPLWENVDEKLRFLQRVKVRFGLLIKS